MSLQLSDRSLDQTQRIGRTSIYIRARSWWSLPLPLKVSGRTAIRVSPTRWMKMLSLAQEHKHLSGLQLGLDWAAISMTYLKTSGSRTTIVLVASRSLRSSLIGLFQRNIA